MFAELYAATRTSRLPFNEQVTEARKRKGWTQRQLARKVGVTPPYISQIEAGRTVPTVDKSKAIATALSPFISQRPFLKKVLRARGIRSEDVSVLGKALTAIGNYIRKALRR